MPENCPGSGRTQRPDPLPHSAGKDCRAGPRYELPDSLHIAKTHSGVKYRIVPGELRNFMADEGEFPRERVRQLTGKGATTAAEIIKLGLTEGYIQSPSEKGILRIAFPTKTLPFYFPNLFIDLPVDMG